MSAAIAALIQADALCFSRNAERIFGPLDFQLQAGEALMVKGDNGSGKTTLLRVLAGLLPRSPDRSDCTATRSAGRPSCIWPPISGTGMATRPN